MPLRFVAPATLALVFLTLLFVSATIVFTALTWSTPSGDQLPQAEGALGFAIVAFVFTAAGAVLALRRPKNLIGWLFLVAAVFMALDMAHGRYLLYTVVESPQSGLPDLLFTGALVDSLWIVTMTSIVIVLLTFPQGRTNSSLWTGAAVACIALAVLGLLTTLITPGPLVAPFDEETNRLGIDAFKDFTFVINFVVLGIALTALAGAISLFRRFRRSTGDEREQLKWFAYVAAWLPPVTMAYVIANVLGELEGAVAAALAFATIAIVGALPIAIGIAVLKYRLYDIDVIVNRTLVYVPLTAILAGLFTAITGLFRALFTEVSGFGSDSAVAISTLAVVALFTPVKNHLQSFVDRLFKEASDPAKPLAALAADARKVFDVLDAEGFIQGFADRAAAALTAANALVYLNGRAAPVVVSGDAAVECVLSFPLVESGTPVGRLEIGPSTELRPFTPVQVAALEKQLDVLARGLVFYAAAMGWEIKRPDQNGPGVRGSVADELGVL